MAFYKEITSLVNEGIAVDTVYHDFTKAFDTVLHNIFTQKMMKCRLNIGTEVDWKPAELPVSVQQEAIHQSSTSVVDTGTDNGYYLL